MLALDIAQFFPSLHCDVIQLMLTKLGFAPELCQLFQSYYDSMSTKYLWNVFFSRDYDTYNGVPQGDPLSPIILVLYLSLILKALFPFSGNGVMCLSFIDNFLLFVSNAHLHDNVAQLKAASTHLDEVLALASLRFEPSKTELLHFTPKVQDVRHGCKPICFDSLFSSLPAVSLH